MSKSVLRKDKTCLNCRHVVDQRFCPNCGQENTESRKTFHHLFIHFFEDLTHYENAFWRTIRNLLFKPSSLTKEYLSGKRLSYLAPVRLYIFISFITFFLITVIPDSEDNMIKADQTKTTNYIDKNGIARDSIVAAAKNLNEVLSEANLSGIDTVNYNLGNKRGIMKFGYDSVKQLDSVQKNAAPSEKFSDFEYSAYKNFILLKNSNTRAEIIEKFKESFIHNLPKVLFIYMPIFALFLWFFHNKKRWYYFDHGIFTLHYFSFLLLTTLLLFLIDQLLNAFGDIPILSFINNTIHFVGYIWIFYYFFPAHHRFYGEYRAVSFIKSMVLFFINSIFILLILILFAAYTFINLH